MKVLVTGNRGFLAKHLVKKFISLNWEIYTSNTDQANLLEEKNLHIYNKIKFDYIFHLAVYTKPGDFNLKYPADVFYVNQKINTNILNYWKSFQSQAKFITFGTSAGYDIDIEMREKNYLIGSPDINLFEYGLTKRMLLVGLQAYAKQYGMKYLYYIPSNFYGPEFDFSDKHFIFDIIKKIYEGKKFNQDVILWGDGNQKRELIYVEDAIDIIMNTLYLENNILNLSSGIELSIKEYVKNICKILNYNLKKIFYNKDTYVGVKSRKIYTDKIKEILPTHQNIELSNGLSETINWFINNYERARNEK